MPKEIETKTENWEEELAILLQTISAKYDKWNYAMNLYHPIEGFIRTLLQTARKETIESVLPREHIELERQDEQSKLMSIGFNACRSQIIQLAREKWGITDL